MAFDDAQFQCGIVAVFTYFDNTHLKIMHIKSLRTKFLFIRLLYEQSPNDRLYNKYSIVITTTITNHCTSLQTINWL